LRPEDASVEDYRALRRRIGTSRNVIVQPSTYGTDNSCTLDALVAFGPTARAVAVVDTSVADAELKRMNGRISAKPNPRSHTQIVFRIGPLEPDMRSARQ
jgi:predicted TIM-barrel fold metal-dependent hydrolase